MKSLPGFLFLACCMLFLVNCKTPDKKRTKYDNMKGIMEWEFSRARDPRLNIVPTEKLLEARRIMEERFQVMNTLRTPVPGISWEERGPSNIGGRTRALIFDLNDASNGYRKVWAAGVSGGLWFTGDITAINPVWSKVDDLFDNLAISSIVQDPSNPLVMYFSTGEGWFNVDAVRGAGIWKSVDGGISWNRLPSTATFYYTQDMLVDANGYVYASIRPASGSAGGIQKSTDGGNTWTTVLTSPVASNDRGGDLEIAPNGDVYATMGTSGSNGGIYRSASGTHGANTGNTGTWVNITPNATGVITAPSNLWQRIEIACSPSDASTMYALFQGVNSSNCTSIQQYNSVTNSWTVRTVPNIIDQGNNSNFTRGQAWYDLIAAVDPNNPSTVYIGGIDALRSDNNGQAWTQISTWSLYGASGFTQDQYVHADHHAFSFAPGSSSRAIIGTDGGIYYTENANTSGTGNKPVFRSKNTGYNVTQYYSVAMHPTQTNYFLAGAQDNGSHKFTASGINEVTEVSGGDGAFCHIDQDNPNLQITSYVYNNFYVSTNGGTSFTSQFFNNRGSFINASDYDDAMNILYSGDDKGFYFRWKDPHNSSADIQEKVSNTAFGTAGVSHVLVSPLTPNRVYFGLADGTVVMTDDAHLGTTVTGTVIKSGGIGVVSGIAIDPGNESHMLVTYSNYGITSVWESFNALDPSPSWTSVEGDLPDMPVRWVIFDPRNSDWAILATELGVWSTNNLDGASTLWSPSNSGLAHVRVDMLRYRPADNMVVAATHGRGLFTAIIPSASTPDISFTSASTAAPEAASFSDGCRKYKDYTVSMTIANPPQGTATVTLSVNAGTGARQGIDYLVTTNNDFNNPSSVLLFEDGMAEPRSFKVRVYDDAEVEAEENLVISYSISGTTDAMPGVGAQQNTIFITDNDQAPIAYESAVREVGTPTYALGTNTYGPLFDSYTDRKRSIMIYRAEELTAQGIQAGNINSLAFNLIKQSTRPLGSLQIKMGATVNDYIIDNGSGVIPGSLTVKTLASFNSVDGWNEFILDNPFAWNGSDNIVVEVCYNNGTADSAQVPDAVIAYPDGGTSGQSSFVFANNKNCGETISSVSAFPDGIKPVIRMGNEVAGTSIATDLTTITESLFSASDQYIYDGNGKIAARIRNLSSTHDYGCAQVMIDRAGNGAKPFWNNETSNMILDKTFRIIPTVNNPSGNYEITLYYTKEEVEGWEAATGQSFNNIQLIKSEGAIGDVSPSAPNAAGIISIVTPVIGTFGPHYTLSYTFDNGFSGFGAGVAGAALPVSLLEFKGFNKSTGIELNWTTGFEYMNRGFEVERSYDGTRFNKISFVASRGPSASGHRYIFNDPDIPQDENYYRLKQVDLDGKATYSNVLLVRVPSSTSKGFRLLTNPVRQHIDVEFGQALKGIAEIIIMDESGRPVLKTNVQAAGLKRLRIPVRPGISSGIYLLKIRNGHQEFVTRFMK